MIPIDSVNFPSETPAGSEKTKPTQLKPDLGTKLMGMPMPEDPVIQNVVIKKESSSR